jgi:hypothetical protein
MYIPERRLTKERRSGMDRRKSPKKKSKHLINFKDHEQNQLYDPAFSLIAPTDRHYLPALKSCDIGDICFTVGIKNAFFFKFH